jgi:hypothetical protein
MFHYPDYLRDQAAKYRELAKTAEDRYERALALGKFRSRNFAAP